MTILGLQASVSLAALVLRAVAAILDLNAQTMYADFPRSMTTDYALDEE